VRRRFESCRGRANANCLTSPLRPSPALPGRESDAEVGSVAVSRDRVSGAVVPRSPVTLNLTSASTIYIGVTEISRTKGLVRGGNQFMSGASACQDA
jgi:hypothetical protein